MNFPDACLFDLDGVLLDTEPLHGKAWTETAAYFGLNLNNNQLKLLQGRRRDDCANQIISWLSRESSVNEILKVHKPISRKFIKEAKSIQGAEELVNWCINKKLPIALVTSSSESSVAYKTAPHAWIEMFSMRIYGDNKDLLGGKPEPFPYLLAAKKLDLDPKDCWVIEDSSSGIKSALDAGCKVWILESNASKEDDILKLKNEFQYKNPNSIKELKSLLKILKSLN